MDPAVLAATPAGTPPPGVVPDFANAEKNGMHWWIVGVVVASLIVSTVVVALRLFARAVIIKTVDWSDYLTILGWIFTMCFMGGSLGIDDKRRGRHQWEMSLQDYLQTTELENICSMFYCIGIMFSKLAILFLFMKVLVPVHEGLIYWVNQTLIWTNAAFYLGGVGGLICRCIPRAKISQPWLPGRCTNVYLSFLLSGYWNVMSDFFILAFPMWAIWRLQMPLKRKFGVTFVFAVGFFALLCSIMRLHATSQIPNNSDLVWIIGKVGMWSSAEMCTVLLCGCFPFLPKLVRSSEDSGLGTAARPSIENLNGDICNRAFSKPSLSTISEAEHTSSGEVGHVIPQLMPTWKSANKRDDIYSPV